MAFLMVKYMVGLLIILLNVSKRMYGWHVISGIDGHDAASIKAAIETAQQITDKPSLLICKPPLVLVLLIKQALPILSRFIR